jgi:hypothetical protein
MVLVDEAHSMGFIGENGRGVAEAQGVIDDVDFIIGTFSKSVGTVGGFCVSNHPKFEILRLVCRPYVFTASLPPSVVATAATSIRMLMNSADKRAHLWENSKRLHAGLRQLGFQLGTEEPQSAIIAVIMPDLETGAAMWEALLNEGLYVNLARPPATPANMTLLRCSLCALHSEEQVGEILGMFAAAGLLAALVLVALVFMVAYANGERERALSAERHSYDVALVVRNASSNMSRAEAALARFVLDEDQKTSGAVYANDWELAGYQIQQLGKLVRGKPDQERRVALLQQLYQKRSGELALAARAAIQKQGQSGISYYYAAGVDRDGQPNTG